MESALQVARKTDHKTSAPVHGHAASPAPANPLLSLQQQAGNQVVQALLRSGFLQPKLAISNPGDPEEREADQVADRIMRSHVGSPTSTSCSCPAGEEMCEECKQKQVAPVARSASGPFNGKDSPMLAGQTQDPSGPAQTTPGSPTPDPAAPPSPPPTPGGPGSGGTTASTTISSILTQTRAAAPDGTANSRTVVGAGEMVDFYPQTNPNLLDFTGTLANWTASAGSPKSATGVSIFTWAAPEVSGDVTITATPPASSQSASTTIKTIAPTEISYGKRSEDVFPAGTEGAGMILDVVLKPLSVSFANVETIEESEPATNVSGYFLKLQQAGVNLSHRPNRNWTRVDANNAYEDHAFLHGPPPLAHPPAYEQGHFDWSIPSRYLALVPGFGVAGQGTPFAKPTLQATDMLGSDGTMMVTKGEAIVVRSPSGATGAKALKPPTAPGDYPTPGNALDVPQPNPSPPAAATGYTHFTGGGAGNFPQPRGHAAAPISSPCSCSEGEEICEACQQKQAVVSRKASYVLQRQSTNPQTNPHSPGDESADPSSDALSLLRGEGGQPLDASTRAFFEPRFGHDFSHVRVHTGAQASESTHSIQALAYTVGNHIVFGASQHQPSTEGGKRLLAHELTHVAQRAHGIRRQSDDGGGLDPKETQSWQAIQSQRVFPWWQEDYQKSLNAVPGASIDLAKALKNNPSPSDADRDRVIQQIRQLIRINAIALMRDNRAYVELKRDELVGKPESVDQVGAREPHGLYGAGAGAGASVEIQDAIVSDPGAIKNALAVRAAAKAAVLLAQRRKKLEDSARAFEIEAGSQGRPGGDSFIDALKFIIKESSDDQSPEIGTYLERLHQSLKGKKTIERGLATWTIFATCRHLEEWRRKQANGVTAALDQIYRQFPFFAQLAPEDMPKEEASSAEVMDRVRDAYATLLLKIDGAIIEIGAGGIDPFDLPEAVRVSRDGLSPVQQQILDQAMKDRVARQFWLDMGLTLAQVLVVFIPVVGPALSVGIGAGQMMVGVHDALSRYQISEAATNPEGSVLGVTGPSGFEWAMLGVNAALTAADLGSLRGEMDASRRHFHEDEPKLIEREPKTEAAGHERETVGERGVAEKEVSAGTAELEREADILEQKLHDPENVQDVLDPDLAKDYDYQVIVEAEEKHTYYHRRDGKSWCRASGPAICGYSFDKEVEEALARVKQARRPSASGKPTEQFVEDFLGARFRKQTPSFEGKRVRGSAKYGMSIADFSGYQGTRRIVVEVKNIDIAANMRTGFVDLRGQVGGYLSNVPHPDTTKFWLFLDIRGQKLPAGGLREIVDSVSSGTGYVFDNIHFITEVGVVVY